MGLLGDVAGIFQGSSSGGGGVRFGSDFQSKLTQWKQGVGSPSDKLYSGDTDFFKKLRTLEATVGSIPFGVDKTPQSGTLSKLAQRTSGGSKMDFSTVPMWAKIAAALLLAFGIFKFIKRKKRR